MKFSKRTKTFAVLTAAAMLLNTTSAIPILNASAEEEKTVSVTLSDWSETLDFSDIEVELPTTTVTLTPNRSGTLNFSDIYSEYDPEADPVLKSFDDDGESGGYQCNYWDIKSDLVAAINQQEGVNLDNNSTVEITDFSIGYSWTYTSTEEERIPNIMVWPSVWGNDADGNSANNRGDLVRSHNTLKGSGTFSTADCTDEGVESLDIIWGFSLNSGASTNNPNDVLEFSWDSVTFTVRYLEGSSGGWKSFNADGKQWKFVHYTDDEGTISPYIQEIAKAIKAETNETPLDWTIKVNDISADYNWVFKTTVENPDVSMYTMVNGNNDTEWVQSDSIEQKFTGTEGSGTISAADFTKEAGLSITDYHGLFIDMGTWTDNPADTLTLTLSNLTFDVTYQTSGYEAPEDAVSVTVPDMTEVVDFSDIPQADYQTTEITLTPNWNGSVSFAGVDPEGDPVLRQMYNEATDSGNYSFDIWNNREDIVSAIEAKEGVTLTDDSPIQMTGVSMTYSWKHTTTDESVEYSIGAWPNVWGYDANGNEVKIGDGYTGYTSKEGSDVFNTATSTISGVQDLDDIHGFGLDMGAWSNNPEDALDVTVERITLTVRYSVSASGSYKDSGLELRHFNDDGTTSAFTEQVLDSIEAQTGSRPEAWKIQIKNITADYEWSFKTAQEAPVIHINSNSAGLNGEDWAEGAYVHDGYSGKTGSGTISAYESATRGEAYLTDYHIMRVGVGSWTDDPDDTLTFTLKNITVDVIIQTESSDDDYSSVYLSYEKLQDAKYLKVSMEVTEKDSCGHDIDHIGDDGVKYYDDWTYCPWPVVDVRRISSDGSIVGDSYSFMPEDFDMKITSAIVSLSDIYAKTGELLEGEQLEFLSSSAVTVTGAEIMDSLPEIDLGTGRIDEVFLKQDHYWDSETNQEVPTDGVDLVAAMDLVNFAHGKNFDGYSAIAIDYTLLNPKDCSAVVVILNGWETNGMGWKIRYYPADEKSGRIIIDLSDKQDKSVNTISVGAVAQPTAQVGDSFSPCLAVTDAKILTSCNEAETGTIDEVEAVDPPEFDELGSKTVNVTIDSDWTNTIDFSGVDTVDGEFRHLYSDETQSGNWYIDKYVNDNINPEIISAIEEQIGDTPCDWPFVINDITAVCEWEVSTNESGSGDTGTVQFFPNTCGIADVPESEGSWREASNSDDPSFNLSEKTGSCNISASRIAALSNVTDISDYFGMGLDIGTWSNDPSATLTLRITSVKLNISYVPKNVMYLSYDELKDAKYVKIYSDVAKKTECGHDNPDHIGDDGVSYFDDWTYCPWTSVKVSRISADGTISDVYDAWPDQFDKPSVTAIESLSDITAVTGELSEGDVLEFAGSSSETVTKVEVIDSLPDIQLDSITIDEVTIEEDTDWDPDLGESVPNGRVCRQYARMMHNSPSTIKINDYPVVKINYTLKNPDECRAIVVIISGWSDDGTDTGWVAKYYPVSGNSGTIIADFSDLMDKTYYQVFAGVITCPTVKIGNAFTPGFTAEGVLMNSNTDKITEEYDYHAPEVVLAENIEIVENIYKEESDDPYILTIDELEAIEAVLENDYNK